MRRTIIWSTVTAASIAVLSFPAFAGARPVNAHPTAAPVSALPVKTSSVVPHPEIKRAIVALQRAKNAMQHAAHDFGGHRAAALVECDKAIAQLQLALQYDKN
jgi:hypothetical protein